jgi:hypothetical protein
MAADCDTDHYPVQEKYMDRLTVSKQTIHRFNTERFHLNKLYEVEGKEQYDAEISANFTALEELNAEIGINSASETVKKNIKIKSPRESRLL